MVRRRKYLFCLRVIDLVNKSRVKDSFQFHAADYGSARKLGYQHLKRRVGYDTDSDVQDLIRFYEGGDEGHMAGYEPGDALPEFLRRIHVEIVRV